MEIKECKSKKCKRALPEGYKYKYCENCRNRRVERIKKSGKGAMGLVAFVGATAITIVTKRIINLKEK